MSAGAAAKPPMAAPHTQGSRKHLIVEVRWGQPGSRKAILEPGSLLQVGSSEHADLSVPGDAELEMTHFSLSWDGRHCQLKDLSGAARTWLNGEPVKESDVPHGGWVRAGATDFLVYFERHTPPRERDASGPDPMESLRVKALEVLSGQKKPLFAILDAARDERILTLMQESVEEHRSLYEGPQGATLADVAPYLVALPQGSALLEALVLEGWGKHWGVFLTSERPFTETRRHFRKFLMARDATGRELYFRFYDPRVLSPFLPRYEPQQLVEFFEGIDALIMESPHAESLLRFSARQSLLHLEAVPLDKP